MTKTFLQSPYFDDYDENKKYYRILFRPSIPVQARELTQLQTSLQTQIERLGKHFFKDGDKVVDGQLSIDTTIRSVKVQGTDDITSYIGKTLTGKTSGAKALVVTASNYEDSSNPPTFFVKFIASGETTNEQEFLDGESVYLTDGTAVVSYALLESNAVGDASIAQVARGVYFVYGNFVLVDDQTIILDKYSNMPTYKVGFSVTESIITPELDNSLYDNAVGSYNESAPGAHRYYIDCILEKRAITADSSNDFIELSKVVNGQILKITKTNEDKTITEDVLARRTYDESGDYMVRQFRADVREHRSNDRGIWVRLEESRPKYLKGDIVRYQPDPDVEIYYTYKALRDVPCGVKQSIVPSKDSGDGYWELVETPKINDGVYNALGRVVGVEILKSVTFTNTPEVSITDQTDDSSQVVHSASAVACLDDDGKLVRIIVVSSDTGFSKEYPITVMVGGETDVARAVVDYGDDEDFAFTLNSGKAYVKGYEIEKVGSTVLAVDKTRTTERVDNEYLSFTNGNYILVTGLNRVPKFSPTVTYNLYSDFVEYSTYPNSISLGPGEVVGNCKIRGVALEKENSQSALSTYKIYLGEITVAEGKTSLDFERDVKSIGLGKLDSNHFFANIVPNYTKLSGTVTSSGTTITGTDTDFLTEVVVGDYVKIGTVTAKVTKITSQNSITLDRSVTSSNNAIYRISTSIVDPQTYSSVYKISDNVISEVHSIDYSICTFFELEDSTGKSHGVVDSTTRWVTFTTDLDNAKFTTPENRTNYILAGNLNGILSVQDKAKEGVGTNTITLLYDAYDGMALDTSFYCIGTVRISGDADEVKEQKTLKTSYTIGSAGATSLELKDEEETMKNCADVKEIVSIKMKENASSTDYTVDISDRFDFDDGQRDCYYTTSKITLKNGFNAPAYDFKVVFKYFYQGSSNKAGFVVNSYFENSTKSDKNYLYDEIPSYNGVNLRNCLDLRQLDTSGMNYMLKGGEEIEISYSYYLPRKDRICLDSKGKFIDVQGMPSLTPQFPEIPSDSMNVYNITIAPYVFDVASDVYVETVDNKRYTMRDIGKLETRIKNLEDYTTLSLLEQETASMSITDSDGLDRFKQGFVVDNFKSTDVVSSTDSEVNCSIDTTNACLRPSYITRNIAMKEYYPDNGTTRSQANYMAYGKVFTLPLDEEEPHVVLVSQPIGTRTENINPFAVVRFIGSLSINPSSDDWYETEYLDTSVSIREGDYEATYDSLNGVIEWDAWEKAWTGVATVTNTSSKTTTKNRTVTSGYDNWVYRDTTTTTTYTWAQTSGYTRSGTSYSVYESIEDYEEIGDYLVSTTNITYMRSRNLLLKARGLKPNTKFYPFFDGVDVSDWCTPASVIQYIPQGTKEFDSTTLASTVEDARIIEDTTNSLWAEPTDKGCLDVGDVLIGSTGRCVLVGKSVDTSDKVNGNKYYLYVVNIKGTLMVDDVLCGSISGASGKIVSITGNGSDQNKHHGDPIVTTPNGECQFIYWIPDANKIDISKFSSTTGYIKFKCGDRVFALNDNENNDNTVSNSRAEATYSATGIINTRQKVATAVRNAKVVTESVSSNKTVTSTYTTQTVGTTSKYLRYYNTDPLAQTFTVECEGGCFISKVDVYFASKDDNIPVKMEIRTTDNGYPSTNILAFGECTLNPEDVKLSSNLVTYLDDDGNSVSEPNFDTPTTFTFESPVYVENGQDYAIVLKSDSTNYRVWIAQIGDTVPGQDYVVSSQPSLGSLFKSQNASTWNAEQTQDLMFTIYRANFQMGVDADIAFVSNSLPYVSLGYNPFETTKDSNSITVWHSNHGFSNGNRVTFINSDPNIIDTGNYITGTASCTSGSNTVVGSNTTFDISVNVDDAFYLIDSDGSPQLIGLVKEVVDATHLTLKDTASVTYTNKSIYREISINGIKPTELFNKTFEVSDIDIDHYTITLSNKTKALSDGYSGGSYIKATTNYRYDIIRPNITSQTFTDAQITYSLSEGNNKTQIALVANDNNEFYESRSIKSDDNSSSSFDDKLVIHCKFNTDNQALSPIIDSDRVSCVLISNIIDDEGISKYITKEIKLADTANFIRIAFDAIVSSDSDTVSAKNKIKVYYQTFLGSDNIDTDWIQIESADKDISSSTDYQSISFSTGELASFDTFKIKIEMLGTNTANVPIISNLRIVACL